ncbi:hypothetical protein [Streptomyces purpurascens]|uniref:hypothetical protein n=1 Tax=Streptomyces purpurascens TaxID=1924 RepID=UPI001671A82D|nr:hypothetical protein [Streptomyces purpurascens]MCE7051223.1 hypothetical protein [Streptomyces purpurascens]
MSCVVRLPYLLLSVLLVFVMVLAAAGPVGAVDRPRVELSKAQAGAGGSVTVSGSGWRARALLTLLVCGQAEPDRGVTGGTNSCANADGRAVTTDAEGRFRRALPVVEPPVPCPCVVHVETVTGAGAEADAALQAAGHTVEPLPAERSGGRLSLLADTRLRGSGGLLTWFGSPPARTLEVTVGNVGTSPVKNPVFQVGTAHGVFAPQWQDQRWRGTIRPGGEARVELPVELAAGAHGDYTVSLKYGGKVLAEHPWGVGRPWGVTLFWVLVLLVVPAAVFRAGLAVVDHLRPRQPGHAARPARRTGLPVPLPHLPRKRAGTRTPSAAPALPWVTPDAGPEDEERSSASYGKDPTTRA